MNRSFFQTLDSAAKTSAGLGLLKTLAPFLVLALAAIGTPLFALLGGTGELAWLLHPHGHLRFITSEILSEHFAGSPILVTIPLFTFVGYVLAEAKTPDRLVHGARTMLGWLPGGLAIVCVIASAIFTVLTGGSGVTIIAIGGLLYPALRKQEYSEKFSLGLVTTGGSVGLLLPYSLPLLVYSLVAHVDYRAAFKAVLLPGGLVIVLLSLYAAFIAQRDGVKREPPRLKEATAAVWALKWELGIPALLIIGLGTGFAGIDESAALVALYVVIIEFFVYKDLSWKKDLPRIARASMTLAGGIILILSMANALMSYVVDERIPTDILNFMVKIGIEHRWQFLLVLNVFLVILGMIMEGFSAILVAVPLIIPFVADLGERHPDEAMSPMQLAMIFLLNLEIAYCVPPLGLNLFIASFRFNKPVTQLYKVVMPFAGILLIALLVVSYVPWVSTVLVRGDIEAVRADAVAEAKRGDPPYSLRQAWILECVQNDPVNPQPCTLEERKLYPGGVISAVVAPSSSSAATPSGSGSATGTTPDAPPDEEIDAGCNPDFGDCPAP
jgi:tripartite ATP-independent transporter DctM subunit